MRPKVFVVLEETYYQSAAVVHDVFTSFESAEEYVLKFLDKYKKPRRIRREAWCLGTWGFEICEREVKTDRVKARRELHG